MDRQRDTTDPRHWPGHRHPAGILVDDKKFRRVIVEEVLNAAIVTRVAVRGVDLFHAFTDHTALLNRRRVVRQIEHRGIVVLITYLYSAQCHTMQITY